MSSFSENLNRISFETPNTQISVERAELTNFALSNQFEQQKLLRYKAKTWRFWIDTGLRLIFSIIYTWLLIVWLNKVIHILTHNNICDYKLSDNVLIALLVTSTANVIGMVVIVLKNLFPEKNKDKKKENTPE